MLQLVAIYNTKLHFSDVLLTVHLSIFNNTKLYCEHIYIYKYIQS